jgi:hypothetical protein
VNNDESKVLTLHNVIHDWNLFFVTGNNGVFTFPTLSNNQTMIGPIFEIHILYSPICEKVLVQEHRVHLSIQTRADSICKRVMLCSINDL